ncbi:lipopolysaccharide biosynthesis protein [Micromonospora auratinigra]|uniref:Membrane protein involved in the export of O-antigen and teichoic acid n=1 Tax=Micromonospora auratinigra TaxID=261654 RepID=A0A1A8Z3F5_9ACTN|nr:polysaccharide biosynthesis C-terminal domain-containing protein [Micromonospora auratinigra]SBT38333.1 Membrane protein involved in the export of O-antigen and teichoic acid [Micromonospora auratinigra]
MTAVTGPTAADQAEENRRGARSGAAGLVGAATSGLFGFVLAVVITRSYGTVGSGAFFAAIGVVTVASAVCTLGAETGLMWALPRRRTGVSGDAARMLPVALVPPLLTALLVAAAGVAGAETLAPRLLGRSGVGGPPLLAVTFALVPVVVAMTLLLAALRCVRPIRAYVAVQFFLLPVARPLLVGAAALVGGGLVLGMTGWLVPAAVALLACLALVAGPLGIGGGARLRAERADWSSFWGFALPRAASAAIDAGSMWVGVLLTSALAGQADAGVFGAVGRYILAGQLAMQGLRVAVSPQLSRLLGRGDRAAAAGVHRQLTTWGLVLSWPVYLLLAVFGLAFLQLFGPQFTAGATAMTILGLAMLVNTGVGNVQSLLLMGGRSGRHLAAVVTGLVVNVGLGLWLIPGHGATGAAIAWAAGITTENLSAFGYARRLVGQPLVDRSMLRAAGATVAGVGLAAAVGVVVAGRGVPGLAVALGVLVAGCVGLLTLPSVRGGVQRIIRQVRGRPDGASVATVGAQARRGG